MGLDIRIAYLTIGAVGIVGNLQVSIVMLSYRPLRRRLSNYFLANQCILDLLLSIIVILMYMVDTSGIVSGVLGELTCRLWYNRSIFLGFFASSLFSVVALTVERYAEIVYPIQHKLRLTRRLVVYSLVVINLAGVIFKLSITAPVFAMINGVCVGGLFPNSYVKKLAGVLNFCFEFFIPLTIIGYCYVGMVRSMNRRIQPQASKTWNKARKGILKTLLFVVLVFVACTTFKQIVTLLYFLDLIAFKGVNDPIFQIPTILAYSNCCLNPLVYFFKYPEFQRGVRWLYCPRRIWNRTNNVTAYANSDNETKMTTERY